MKNSIDNRIHSIDAWRFNAMFFVVAIHLPFTGTAGQVVITFGKTAVPFFIMASGFSCYRDDDAEFSKRLLRQIVKFIWISVLATLLYSVVNLAVFVTIQH